ncbi:hypothetical protein [Streptomyces luteogriseus]|uniref:hypothetical protein n=1 Tax=Streptomyces luteogriseus TaxID=68233 RepID=UPI0037FDF8A3
MIIVVTVLVSKGMKSADAVLVVSCTGLFGAAVVRICTTIRLSPYSRLAWAELQSNPA